MAKLTLDDKTEDNVRHFMQREGEHFLDLHERLTSSGLTDKQAAAVIRDELLRVALQYECGAHMADGDLLPKERWLEISGLAYDQYEDVMYAAHALNMIAELAEGGADA